MFVTQPTVTSAKATYRGAYSNLVDAKSRKEVKKVLLDARLSEKNVNAWLSDVKDYNKTIKNTGLVKKGFKKLSTKIRSMMRTRSWNCGIKISGFYRIQLPHYCI